MFQIEEYIMYDSKGACQVKEIRKGRNADGVLKDYYVLQMVYDTNSVIITPADNEKVSMRRILSEEAAEEVISQMSEVETPWITNDKVRSVEYRNALRSNDYWEWIKLSKALHKMKVEKCDNGKKLSQTDEDIYRRASKMLNEEMSLALGIPFGKVEEYIQLKLA